MRMGAAMLAGLSRRQLQDFLQENGLPSTGSRAQLEAVAGSHMAELRLQCAHVEEQIADWNKKELQVGALCACWGCWCTLLPARSC